MTTTKLSSESQIAIPAQILLTQPRPLAALQRLREIAGTLDVSLADEVERSRQEWEEYSNEIERIRIDDAP